jgi:DNA-binding MarR family transcriptional regulator
MSLAPSGGEGTGEGDVRGGDRFIDNFHFSTYTDPVKTSSSIIEKYIVALTRLTNKYAALAKAAVDFGTGETLTAVEIHSIEAVGRNKGITVSRLSDMFGVTKGAVSQIMRKLELKGYVSKTRQQDSWKEIDLSLTEKGRKAFRGHEAFHRKMDSGLIEEIEKYSDKEIEAHLQLLKKIEEQVDRYIARIR